MKPTKCHYAASALYHTGYLDHIDIKHTSGKDWKKKDRSFIEYKQNNVSLCAILYGKQTKAYVLPFTLAVGYQPNHQLNVQASIHSRH